MFNDVLHEFFSRHSCLLDDVLAIAGTKLFTKLFRENWRYGRLWFGTYTKIGLFSRATDYAFKRCFAANVLHNILVSFFQSKLSRIPESLAWHLYNII